jgi:hypothetical protein
MWRTLAASLAILYATVPAAHACVTDAGFAGIVFDRVPDDAPAHALVLDVEFEGVTEDRPIDGQVIKARVRQVVRGDYRGDYVRVAIPDNSCSRPFLFGAEGLIVGQLRIGYRPVKFTIHFEGWSARVEHIGHDGTWFDPQSESLQSRYLRGGSVPFAPVDRVLSHDRSSGMPLVQDETELTWFDQRTRTLRHGVMGDYDGDARLDRAGFLEDGEGNLVITVERAARPNEHEIIWSGDVSSAPYFRIRNAAPGLYRTMCHLYEHCGGAIPREVDLRHDGLVVAALEGPAEFLYYWDGDSFENVVISE